MALRRDEQKPAEEAEAAPSGPAGPDREARWDHLYLILSRDLRDGVVQLDRVAADENWKRAFTTAVQLATLSAVLDRMQDPPT